MVYDGKVIDGYCWPLHARNVHGCDAAKHPQPLRRIQRLRGCLNNACMQRITLRTCSSCHAAWAVGLLRTFEELVEGLAIFGVASGIDCSGMAPHGAPDCCSICSIALDHLREQSRLGQGSKSDCSTALQAADCCIVQDLSPCTSAGHLAALPTTSFYFARKGSRRDGVPRLSWPHVAPLHPWHQR